MPRVRLGHWVVGMQGVALLRGWLRDDLARAGTRVAELRALVDRLDEGLPGVELDWAELGVREGYGRWATTYDDLPNPLIRVEEPAVRTLLADVPAGVALDAACGTGRHAVHLRERGHRVLGVDATPGMLERARRKLPDVEFREGTLAALPVASATVDVAVCALALTHVADVRPAIAELARVVRSGGRLVVSDFHPAMELLGGSTLFQAADGTHALVEACFHGHDEYVAAFRACGLAIRGCVEPRWTAAEIPLLAGPLFDLAPGAFHDALVGVPAALVWDVART
jgi:SAM-dependent methyltransferase